MPHCRIDGRVCLRQGRLSVRLGYFIKRFHRDASHWQLVIWLRQVTLLLLVSSTADVLLPRFQPDIPWIRAFLTLAVLLASLVSHVVVQPYSEPKPFV